MDDRPQAQCLGDKVKDWDGGIRTLVRVARKHLQAAYAVLKKSLHQEWAFLQCTTKVPGEGFWLLEKSLW